MFQNMFDRLLALFMVVILLVVLIGGAFSMMSIRTSLIENRMESLLNEAHEIAFLASQVDNSLLSDYFGLEDSAIPLAGS